MIYKIFVNGRVQGVNFCHTVLSFARKQGLQGTVRELDNGGVEIFVACTEKHKEKFVEWLWSSPGFSSVREVEVFQAGTDRDFEGFRIAHGRTFFEDQKKNFLHLRKRFLKF